DQAQIQVSGMPNAVDLSAYRDKSKHQHRWIIVARYDVDVKTMSKMAERRLQARALLNKGVAVEDVEKTVPAVEIPLSQPIGMDGPGCAKCSIHWAANEGWGELCPVSDEEEST